MTQRYYSAFVSYSHKDDKWTKWLLSALEAYRVPRHLVGTEGGNGTVPAKLTRIFRDREELAAGACLDTKVKEALKQSQTLLVVCSPNAVHSYGVNQEIELFRKIRGDEHIFYIIKEGEPHARARGLDPDLECFPKALLYHHLETTTSYGVPLAADARAKGDGRKMALLKVVAGILGLNLDTLVRRDLQRRQRRLWGITGLAAAGMLLTTGLATYAYLASKQAEEALEHAQLEQNNTEGLISYIIGELGLALKAAGDVDLLANMADRVRDHYEGHNSPYMGPREISMKVRGLTMVLNMYLVMGNTEKLDATMEKLLAEIKIQTTKHPNEISVLGTHLMILKQMTDLKFLAGNYEEALRLVGARLILADRTMHTNSGDPAWPLELTGHAYIDKSAIYMHYLQRPQEAVKYARKGLQLRISAGQTPNRVNSFLRLSNVGGGYHHLAMTEEIALPLADAIATHKEGLRITEEHIAELEQKEMKYLYYYRFHTPLGEHLMHAGRMAEAYSMLDTSAEGMKQYIGDEQQNPRFDMMLARVSLVRGKCLLADGKRDQAVAQFREAARKFADIFSRAPPPHDALAWQLSAETLYAQTLLQQGKVRDAETAMIRADQLFEAFPTYALASVYGRKMQSIYINAKAELADVTGNMQLASTLWTKLTNTLGPKWRDSHPAVKFELMRAYRQIGDMQRAREIAQQLKSIGMARKDFLNELKLLEVRPDQVTGTAAS